MSVRVQKQMRRSEVSLVAWYLRNESLFSILRDLWKIKTLSRTKAARWIDQPLDALRPPPDRKRHSR
jgi:hypothetical protein